MVFEVVAEKHASGASSAQVSEDRAHREAPEGGPPGNDHRVGPEPLDALSRFLPGAGRPVIEYRRRGRAREPLIPREPPRIDPSRIGSRKSQVVDLGQARELPRQPRRLVRDSSPIGRRRAQQRDSRRPAAHREGSRGWRVRAERPSQSGYPAANRIPPSRWRAKSGSA